MRADSKNASEIPGGLQPKPEDVDGTQEEDDTSKEEI